MKLRLATNIDGNSLGLILLLEYAYSDGANLIFNTNEESGLNFSIFSVFLAKCHFEGKSCLPSVAHNK